MSDNSEDLELFHYGVKGMKWGVRKDKDGPPRKSIRQRIKDRDEAINKSRDELGGAALREAKAVSRSAKTKVGVVRNLRDPNARADAKAASKERRAATANRREVQRSATRKTSKEIALKGALWLGPALAGTATLAVGTAATRKNARIGREYTAGLFSDTNGLPRPGTIALQFVDGVWQ